MVSRQYWGGFSHHSRAAGMSWLFISNSVSLTTWLSSEPLPCLNFIIGLWGFTGESLARSSKPSWKVQHWINVGLESKSTWSNRVFPIVFFSSSSDEEEEELESESLEEESSSLRSVIGSEVVLAADFLAFLVNNLFLPSATLFPSDFKSILQSWAGASSVSAWIIFSLALYHQKYS